MLRGVTAMGTDPVEYKPCLNEWGLSMDDVLVLAGLRSLTCVSGVEFPPTVSAYVEARCAKAGVDLFTDRAC